MLNLPRPVWIRLHAQNRLACHNQAVQGGNVGVRKDDQTVNGVWREWGERLYVAIKKGKSVFEKVFNLIYSSSLCIGWQYTKLDVLAKVFDSEKKKDKQTAKLI